jgi:ArsR family transcriptional regulator, arsenate/arsenite/antimonite-responsive transcriptional repressor / arsenate reductase (thioredoxin)
VIIVRGVSESVDQLRVARYAALGEPGRLAVIDALILSDRTPSELGEFIGAPSNLLAHHLDVLEAAGLIGRSKSSGDGRRRYVHVIHAALPSFTPPLAPRPALFVCTQNSARSQLAAALWTAMTGSSASSAGTQPASEVHRLAIAAARRAGLDLSASQPRLLGKVPKKSDLVITVCDQVHEELDPAEQWLHWSITDPVADGRAAAFDDCIAELRGRITSTTGLTAA